jgi:hypothetical protein
VPVARRVYLAYLLRLWEVDTGGQQVWRASLQDPRTGERRGFANLAELGTFLAEQIGSPAQAGPDSKSKGIS